MNWNRGEKAKQTVQLPPSPFLVAGEATLAVHLDLPQLIFISSGDPHIQQQPVAVALSLLQSVPLSLKTDVKQPPSSPSTTTNSRRTPLHKLLNSELSFPFFFGDTTARGAANGSHKPDTSGPPPGHHEPPFQKPPRQKEPPRSPLPNGSGR